MPHRRHQDTELTDSVDARQRKRTRRTEYPSAVHHAVRASRGDNQRGDRDGDRVVRRLTAAGIDDRENEVLFSAFSDIDEATANVIFFPGDVQDFSASMEEGVYSEYEPFSYENVARMLSTKFGKRANVWIIRPSRFQSEAYACFDNFVSTTSKTGAALSYSSGGKAVPHLMALMENVRATLDNENVDLSLHIPIHLVGFSKGAIVLNQIATEAARWISSQDNTAGASVISSDMGTDAIYDNRFFSKLSSIHWIDSGNGSCHGAVPTDIATIRSLQKIKSLRLCIHATPYQLEAQARPWIKTEIRQFVDTMNVSDVHVELKRYFEKDARSLLLHFQLLSEFDVPSSFAAKIGASCSPEVEVEPYRIQDVR